MGDRVAERSMFIPSSPVEGRRALGAEGSDAFDQILGGRSQRAGETFDGRVGILSLGEIDHGFHDLGRYGSSPDDVGGDGFGARQPLPRLGEFVDEAEREGLFGLEHPADQRGAMPSPVSGRPSFTPFSATLMSPTAASSNPPPNA